MKHSHLLHDAKREALKLSSAKGFSLREVPPYFAIELAPLKLDIMCHEYDHCAPMAVKIYF